MPAGTGPPVRQVALMGDRSGAPGHAPGGVGQRAAGAGTERGVRLEPPALGGVNATGEPGHLTRTTAPWTVPRPDARSLGASGRAA